MVSRTGPGVAAAMAVVLLAACSAASTAASGTGATTSSSPSGAGPPAVWTTRAAPTGATLTYLSCSSVDHCVAASGGSGTIEISTDFGRAWTAHPLPPGVVVVNALSCGDNTHCVLVGVVQPAGIQAHETADFLVTSNGGTSWSAVPAPAGIVGLDSVSCGTGTDCVAIGVRRAAGPEALSSTDGGSTWSVAASSLGAGEALVSCQSASSCWLADGGYSDGGPLPVKMLHSTDLGHSWRMPGTAFHPMEAISGVACPAAPACVVVGSTISNGEPSVGDGDAWSTEDSGDSWLRGTVPSSVTEVLAVACSGPHDCWAVGRAGNVPNTTAVILASTDGGENWVPEQPMPAPDLSAVACFAPGNCLAVGPVDIATLGNPD